MQQTAGARAAYVLRNVLGELGAITAPSIYSLAVAHQAFNEQGELAAEDAALRFHNYLNELDWFVAGLKQQRSQHGTPEVAKARPPNATQAAAAAK